MITLYTRPNCPWCDKAAEWLSANGFAFEKADVRQDPAAMAKVKGDGHTTVPQLYAGGKLLVEGGYGGMTTLGADGMRARLAAGG